MMDWHSAGDFARMGGYALYVWGSVGACLLAVVAELAAVRRRRRAILGVLRREVRARRLDDMEGRAP